MASRLGRESAAPSKDEAAAELFDRYAGRLVGLARQRLSARIGARVDAGDIVQSAYCTFFVGARDGRYVVQHSGDLWRLVAITLHKLRRQVQVHTADFTADSKTLVAGRNDGGTLLAGAGTRGDVTVWHVGSRERRHGWELSGAVSQVAFSPDGRYLLVRNGNGTVYVLRLVAS